MNSTLSGNMSSQGGGISIRGAELRTTKITNSTVSGNSAQSNGGGIYIAGGNAIVESSTISANNAPAGRGGGIAIHRDAWPITFEIYSSIVVGNGVNDIDFVAGLYNSLIESLGNNLIGTGEAVGDSMRKVT